MHIRAVTKKAPHTAEVNPVVFFLDIIAAIVGLISQINTLVVNIRAKNATT
jgi:hypothetical protein